MKQEISRKNALLVLNWCKTKFGQSSINGSGSYPKLVFHRSQQDPDGKLCLGGYEPWKNIIEIYAHSFHKKNRRFLTFINTVIHEFTHYHQPIKSKYFKYTNYDTNPLEIEANQVAKKYQYECYEKIFK